MTKIVTDRCTGEHVQPYELELTEIFRLYTPIVLHDVLLASRFLSLTLELQDHEQHPLFSSNFPSVNTTNEKLPLKPMVIYIRNRILFIADIYAPD